MRWTKSRGHRRLNLRVESRSRFLATPVRMIVPRHPTRQRMTCLTAADLMAACLILEGLLVVALLGGAGKQWRNYRELRSASQAEA